MAMTSLAFFKSCLAVSVSLVGLIIGSGLLNREAYSQEVILEQNENCTEDGTLITCGIGQRAIAYYGPDLSIVAATDTGMSAFSASGNAVSLEGYGNLSFDNSTSGATAGGGSLIGSESSYGVYIKSEGYIPGYGGCCGSGEVERPPGSVIATVAGEVSGVYAENTNQTGPVVISILGSSKIEAKTGILASNSGGGGLSIQTGNSSEVIGKGNYGIAASNSGANGLSIETGEDSFVTGYDSGINASNSSAGDLSIKTGKNSTIKGDRDSGIYASNSVSGNLSITTGVGSTISGGYGLNLFSVQPISVTNAGIIEGSNAAISARVYFSTDIVNDGILRNSSGLDSDVAVQLFGIEGPSQIGKLTNNGAFIGRLETDSNSVTVINAAGATWQTSGISSFTGTFDLIINNGLLKVISGDASFTGLEFFGGTGTIDMVNSSASDTLSVFTGYYSPGGTLSLDVLLNGEDSMADRLVIDISQNDELVAQNDELVALAASETPGVMTIKLNYLLGGSEVAPVGGLVLVESPAELPAGTFILDQSLTGSNLFFTDSVVNRPGIDGGTEIVLERQFNPDTSVLPPPLPPPSIITVDAEPKLDSAMGVPGVETPGVEPGPYVQTVGSAFSADTEGTLRNGGESFNIDAPYDMTVVGVIAGLDRMQKGTSAKGTPYAWLIGGFGGYVTSNATFVDRAGSQQSNGGVAGAYAAAAYGPWRFHLAAKTDFGVTEMSTGSDSDHSTYLAPGVAFNAGYRYQLSPVSYLQPIATLSYVHRSLGDVSLEGTDISYSDTESLRGRIGFRIASFGRGETHTIEPWMQASLWHEFLGESQATFTGASGALDFTGLGAGTFAEVGGGVNVLSQTVPGLSGNLRTELSFGERSLIGLSGKLGVEYRFPVN